MLCTSILSQLKLSLWLFSGPDCANSVSCTFHEVWSWGEASGFQMPAHFSQCCVLWVIFSFIMMILEINFIILIYTLQHYYHPHYQREKKPRGTMPSLRPHRTGMQYSQGSTRRDTFLIYLLFPSSTCLWKHTGIWLQEVQKEPKEHSSQTATTKDYCPSL